ncbi:IS3 family transposase [Iamia majanohamensis]|uniref:IS3 family transposase n=1 Tax=Iamia majanohamensis TaxID=467976 RepID=A0AAE9YA00_9ACTN|nr:IS3 family transposase [Iamia majanohamensis]WCO67124.1 IS3 family transposase [Iamia majanohamensis]
MPAPRKYPDELRERAIRLVLEAREQDEKLSLNAAVQRIGPRVGVNPDTLRTWAKQAEIDDGRRPGTTTSEAARVRELEAEVRELKRANEILLAASSFFRAGARPATALVVAFIDEHRDRFGVEPICRVLCEHGVGIAPSTYYATKTRPRSARSIRDEAVLAHIRRIHGDPKIGRGLYGARKVFHQLQRETARGEHPDLGPVPRCQIERLMAADGLRGARRGKAFVTTRPDPGAARPPDLVRRNFTRRRPNQLWVVDFTYIATWAGTVFTAFVTDVFSRRIVGWRTAAAMPTELPLDALEMALWTRAQADQLVDGLVHHSDAGSQYTSIRYADRIAAAGAVASIGTVGDSYDNAMAESTIGLYKTECVHHEGPWRGVEDLELATLNWVHWFNEIRLHSAIGHIPPTEHEADYYRHHPRPHPESGQPALH